MTMTASMAGTAAFSGTPDSGWVVANPQTSAHATTAKPTTVSICHAHAFRFAVIGSTKLLARCAACEENVRQSWLHPLPRRRPAGDHCAPGRQDGQTHSLARWCASE